MSKLIHPKTGTVREIDDMNSAKAVILTRAGFIPIEKYKPPVVKTVEPEPTLADMVEAQGEKMEVAGVEMAAEKAIHAEVPLPISEPEKASILISPIAQELIIAKELDPSLITGTGKDGKIVKSDVLEYLTSLEAE